MADVKRLNYFNHQFLVEADFTDEQQYHLAMRRRHNAALHHYGAADGLLVTRAGDKEITVTPGIASDREGRELVLLDSRSVDLANTTAYPAGATVYITIAYHEEQSDPSTATGVTGYTRSTERPEVRAVTSAPAGDGSLIRLAEFVLTAAGNVPGAVGDIFSAGRQASSAVLAAAAVTTDHLANAAVTSAKLADSAVGTSKLAEGAVTENKLASSAVTTVKLADNSVSSTKIAAGSVASSQLADGAVSNAKLADSAVTTTKIADGNVATAKLADAAVSEAKIGNGAVSTAKLADSAVTENKLASSAVTTAKLADNSVSSAKIAAGAVGSSQLADGAVGEGKLSADALGKLVTNGNAHDHSGGDGAQVSHSALLLDGGSNPHRTTATDVGALPATGGTLSGLLYVSGEINVDGDFTTGASAGYFHSFSPAGVSGSGPALIARAESDSNDGTVLAFQSEAFGSGSAFKQGASCSVSGSGPKQAGYFSASSPTGGADYTRALIAEASSEGTGGVSGLVVNAWGAGTGSKEGISSWVGGAGSKLAGTFNSYSEAGTADETRALVASASSDGTGYVSGLSVQVLGAGTGQKDGIYSSVSGAGTKYAGRFYASSDAGSADSTQALDISAGSEGTGSVLGLGVYTGGQGTGWRTGMNCQAAGVGSLMGGSFYAQSSSTSDSSPTVYGLYSYADGGSGNGPVFGLQSYVIGNGSGPKYGIFSSVSGTGTLWAGYFSGNVYVGGTLSKASGTFLIDHPLDPENKTLRHSFVESPEDLCLYRGKVQLDGTGKASVKMPSYFAALTREEDATVSLTAIGSKPFLSAYEWNRNFTAFTVYGEAGREVSYLVLADRDDPVIHRLRRPVEEHKGAGHFEKGELLNPEAYGKAAKAPGAPLTAGGETGVTRPEMAMTAAAQDNAIRQETWARNHEEQRQRMESLRQEDERRRKEFEATRAAPRSPPGPSAPAPLPASVETSAPASPETGASPPSAAAAAAGKAKPGTRSKR